MAEEHRPPRGCAPLTAARRRQDRQPLCERKLSDDETIGGDGSDAFPSSEHRRAPSRGPEGERARRMQEEQGMTSTREIDPFLKGDFPSCAPERPGQSLPRCAPRIPPYDTGARPHASYRSTRSTKKANHHTRGEQPPVVMRPFTFGATSGREDEPPHKERATAPRLGVSSFSPKPAVKKANRHVGSEQSPHGCALPQLHYNRRSNMQTQARMSCNRRAGYGVRKNRTAACANAVSPWGRRRRLKR
jgi:hypothetical protein